MREKDSTRAGRRTRPGRPQGAVGLPDFELREELRTADTQMRRIRWFAVPFALVQFVLYRPPAGVHVPFPALRVGVAVAALIAGVNVISLWARRIQDEGLLVRVGTGQLIADSLLTLGVVWLFRFDTTSALWALLIFPVLEGAIRGKRRGALSMWALCAVGYLARDLATSTEFANAPFRIESVTYRMGIILIVAIASGSLAKNLDTRIAGQLRARRESEHRATLLKQVAAAGRAIATLEADAVLAAVVDCATQIGFEEVGVVLFDDAGETFMIVEGRGAPERMKDVRFAATSGLVGLTRNRQKTVVVDDYASWSDALPEFRDLGLRAAAGTPIWFDRAFRGVLVGGTRRRGSISPYEVECFELLAQHAGGALNNAREFERRRELEAKLQHDAFHDALTALPNRALFVDRLNHCLDRKAATSPTAVLFVDLDGFKKINDSLGHEAGDEVLRTVGDRLRMGCAAGDTVARFGGDEFTILVEEPGAEHAARELGDQIVEALRQPFTVNGKDVFVTASVGVVCGAPVAGRHRDFLREADLAMYRAKEEGGNRAAAYRAAMTIRADRRLEMETELRRAVAEDQLVLHYQPVVALDSGALVGLEALVRWNHPEGGLLRPIDFIPFAEETGLIVDVGHWITDHVCAQVGEWRRRSNEIPAVPVSMNLSANEFAEPRFVDFVERTFKEHALDPTDVVFEVTESVVMRDDAPTLERMHRLGELGIRIAIDDFGLGYSSLSYLRQFDFSVLKIDRSFVAGITSAETDRAIIRSILALAADLGIAVVAEGVEAREQWEYLQAVGCRFAQGNYISKPVVPEALASFVKQAVA